MTSDSWNCLSLLNCEEMLDGGFVSYNRQFFEAARASKMFSHLETSYLEKTSIDWKHLKYMGRVARRGTAWFADQGVEYHYAGQEHLGCGWDPFVDEIRQAVESFTGAKFNSVLMNYYGDGKAKVGWHSDAEPELGTNPVIASLSFGADRVFKLRHDSTGAVRNMVLHHNSLLIMGGTLQHHYKHSIAEGSGAIGPRFNFTFRYTIPR